MYKPVSHKDSYTIIEILSSILLDKFQPDMLAFKIEIVAKYRLHKGLSNYYQKHNSEVRSVGYNQLEIVLLIYF